MDYNSSQKLPAGYTVDDYFRIQFFSTVMVDGVQTIEWHDAIKCNEKYAERVAKGEDGLDGELEDDLWICPDVQNIKI